MTEKKSAQIHQLYGNPSNLPAIEKRDVRPAPIVPGKPNWLSKRGREVWDFLAPELEKNALLTKRDREAFGMACEDAAVAQTVLLQMRDDRNNYGPLVDVDKGNKGRTRRHPAWVVYREATASFRAWCKEFGLTPNARVGLLVGGAAGALPNSSSTPDDEDDEEVFG